MNPHTGWALCGQRREEQAVRMRARQALRAPRASRLRGLPRWNVSWTRLSPGDLPGTAGQPRSSWMIIISAGRPG
jgi:hypothetical protein